MTYEDCMDLVEAHTASAELAVDEDLTQEQVQKVKSIRDCVGDFIGKIVHRGISGVSQEEGQVLRVFRVEQPNENHKPFPDVREEAMTNSLEPCPFCGHTGIHMRRKTRTRESTSGLRYDRDMGCPFDDPFAGHYYGPVYKSMPCLDYRFGFRFYCGRCGASPYYVWGEWHIATEDEVDEYDLLPHCCDRFDEEEEAATIERARGMWNRRAYGQGC